MANRPVFCSESVKPFYTEIDVEFQYYSGFSIIQKQRSIRSLHDSFLERNPERKVLEVSSKSSIELGSNLSAFNLKFNTPKGKRHIENVFQAGKKFQYGGPYEDILDKTPVEAKKDERLKTSGDLVSFHLGTEVFALEPKDYFYNWIYSRALYDSLKSHRSIFEYDAFTDIEFNPAKSINCQARTVAIFVGLYKAGLLDDAMKSKEAYLEIVYGQKEQETYTQMSLF